MSAPDDFGPEVRITFKAPVNCLSGGHVYAVRNMHPRGGNKGPGRGGLGDTILRRLDEDLRVPRLPIGTPLFDRLG